MYIRVETAEGREHFTRCDRYDTEAEGEELKVTAYNDEGEPGPVFRVPRVGAALFVMDDGGDTIDIRRWKE